MDKLSNDEVTELIFSSKEIAFLQDQKLFEQFSGYINNLVNTDFQKLLYLLYRIDVNEASLKKRLLKNPQKNAGDLIASIIIERQVQKIKSRQETSRDQNISDEEAW